MKKLIAIALCALTIGSAAVVAPAVSPDTSSPFSITANAAIASGVYRRGSRGAAVSHIQYNLRILGYNVGSVDGIYGAKTETAVKAFQKNCKFSAKDQDGICGPKTLKYLNSAGKQLQTLLNQAGYKCTIDSICGPNTINCLNRFQRDYKFKVCNYLTTSSIKKLKEVAANKGLSNGASTAVSNTSKTNSQTNASSLSNQRRQNMVNIAYREYNARTQGMYNKYNGYNGQNWCKYFVCYVANQAGVPTSVITDNYYRCDYTQEWFEARGRSYAYKSSLNVQPGDLVILGNGNVYVTNSKGESVLQRPHIGIVVEVTGSTIKTIEGNTSGYASSCVNVKYYKRSNGRTGGNNSWGINYVLKPAY